MHSPSSWNYLLGVLCEGGWSIIFMMILSFANLQRVCVLLDALPAALQSPGETAPAEVVHSHVRTWKEEDHQGNDLHGVVTTTALLQLPSLERPEDHLQEVSPTSARCLLDFVFLFITTHGCSPRHGTNCIFCNLFYYMRVNVAPIKLQPCYLLPGMPACISAWL